MAPLFPPKGFLFVNYTSDKLVSALVLYLIYKFINFLNYKFYYKFMFCRLLAVICTFSWTWSRSIYLVENSGMYNWMNKFIPELSSIVICFCLNIMYFIPSSGHHLKRISCWYMYSSDVPKVHVVKNVCNDVFFFLNFI